MAVYLYRCSTCGREFRLSRRREKRNAPLSCECGPGRMRRVPSGSPATYPREAPPAAMPRRSQVTMVDCDFSGNNWGVRVRSGVDVRIEGSRLDNYIDDFLVEGDGTVDSEGNTYGKD
jgi:putative FmdB family regulatory protein